MGIKNLDPLRPMFQSYRNQPIDLISESNDWFLNDGNIGREPVSCRGYTEKDQWHELG